MVLTGLLTLVKTQLWPSAAPWSVIDYVAFGTNRRRWVLCHKIILAVNNKIVQQLTLDLNKYDAMKWLQLTHHTTTNSMLGSSGLTYGVKLGHHNLSLVKAWKNWWHDRPHLYIPWLCTFLIYILLRHFLPLSEFACNVENDICDNFSPHKTPIDC